MKRKPPEKNPLEVSGNPNSAITTPFTLAGLWSTFACFRKTGAPIDFHWRHFLHGSCRKLMGDAQGRASPPAHRHRGVCATTTSLGSTGTCTSRPASPRLQKHDCNIRHVSTRHKEQTSSVFGIKSLFPSRTPYRGCRLDQVALRSLQNPSRCFRFVASDTNRSFSAADITHAHHNRCSSLSGW